MKRVRSIVNGKTIYNVYDASGTLTHVDAVTDNKKTDYISKTARISNGVITYLHPDHLGSAVSGTTSTGAMAWTERYTPFGETMLSPTANDNLGGYTGHIKDAATGLNYMQARYYDPALGRFLSIDPVGFTPEMPFMFGRYTYVGNDPVNAWDPDGERTFGLNAEGQIAIGPGIKLAAEVAIDTETGEFRVSVTAGRRVGLRGKASVSGFIEPIVKELPLEYAVELNKLIELEIENSVRKYVCKIGLIQPWNGDARNGRRTRRRSWPSDSRTERMRVGHIFR